MPRRTLGGMATRKVHSCDLCKQEVECDQIPLSGGVDFDICKACFEARGLQPLMAAARKARETAAARQQTDWYQQHRGAFAGQG